MANRKNTFLIKRSNVAGKVPAAGDLQLGELALNTADNILYASGTTANSILPIGWDRIARTGDTVTGNFNFFGDIKISGSSLPNGYALSVTGDTNFIGDVYVTGDLTYNGSLLVTGGTVIQSGLTANTIYTDYIDFNTNYSGATLPAGRLQWDDGNGTLVLGLKGGISDMEIGLENMALCYNDEATTLTAGTVVYVSGSQGNRPSIKRAIATGDGYSVTTLGVVSESIASGAQGFVTTFGMVNNLNTVGYSGGTPIWLSPTDAGGYTAVKPQAPYHTVLIGYVVRVHASVGSIFVHVSNGWEIDELHDVRINDKVQGDLLTLSAYNGSDVWVNSKILNGSYTMTGLTVQGSTSSDLVRITQTGIGNALVVEDENNPDSSPFIVNASGFVGVGTYNPLSKFVVSNNNSEGIEMGYATGLTSNYLESYNRNTGYGVDMSYYIANTGAHRFYTNSFERVRIDNSGNVGIGTNSPTNKLDVFGNTRITETLSASTLISTQSSGDEGGDLKLATAATNTTLSGGSITVDIYQNRFRIFESGGSNRGVYIDLTAAATGVGTNLLSGGGGEINTASNLGAGTGLFAQKVAADLQFKSLTSTGGTVTISNDANTVNLEVIPASNFTGGTVTGGTIFTNGLSANTISATTYFNLPTDVTVTGGTYSNSTGIATFTNNTGGTFTVTGFSTGTTLGTYLTGATYSNNVITFTTNSGTTSTVTINTVTGLTSSGTISSSVLSATTYQNLPIDIHVTGGTYSDGTATFTNNTGGTFTVTGIGSTGSNVGSGTTIFSGTSGSTLIFKSLTSTASTITIQGNAQTVNLETNAGVKVIPIATSSTAIGTGSNDYYINFKVPYNFTISKIDFSVSTAGSDSVRIGIYRGQDLTAVLVGQSAGGTVSTLNSVSIIAESGQNLHFKAGEWMVIGVAVGGTTTNLFGMACPANNLVAWTNTTDSTGGFPTNPRSKAGTRTSFPSIEINIV